MLKSSLDCARKPATRLHRHLHLRRLTPLPSPARSMSVPVSPRRAETVASLDPRGTVFAEFTPLANKHGAVNLGQGFPTLEVAEFVREAAAKVTTDKTLMHQYTRSEGHLRLVKEIVVTVGASEAIYDIIHAFVNPGDEVILMEPFYDSYPASVLLAGGKPVFVPLRPKAPEPGKLASSDDWKLDLDELKKAVTDRTRIILVNNPHNPIGKVFTREELEGIAEIAKAHDLLVLSDEVYETLVYKGIEHIKMATLSGMWERTLTVGSVGKTFSVTGWKIGWAVGPAELCRAVWMVHQFVSFAVVTPLQEATAIAFEESRSNGYFDTALAEYDHLRGKLVEILASVGLNPAKPDGGYFVLANVEPVVDSFLAKRAKDGLPAIPHDEVSDYDLCRFLTAEIGVCAIPVSAFFGPGRKPAGGIRYARFAFCKTEKMLEDARVRLQAWYSTVAQK